MALRLTPTILGVVGSFILYIYSTLMSNRPLRSALPKPNVAESLCPVAVGLEITPCNICVFMTTGAVNSQESISNKGYLFSLVIYGPPVTALNFRIKLLPFWL